jgi:HK97 family phage portal protein
MGLPAELVTRSGLIVSERGARQLLERRDPTAATQPLVHISPGLGQVPEWDATTAFRMGYIANVIAYRCVQIIARDVASVTLRASRKVRDRNTLVEDAPIAKLLGPPPGGPAPKLSASKLIRWTVAQQIVAGRRAWEIETADGKPDGRPVAFWPLVAANLKEVPSDGGAEWFKVFEYGRSDKPRRLQPDQVFYGWDPSGLDFRQAESALQSARFDLSLAIAADRYSVAFLRNNATPATIVTTDAFPSQDKREAFQRQWQSEFGGVDNAGRTHFYEAGDGDGPVGEAIHVQRLGLSQRDAQLAETRKVALAEVAMAIGVPWSKLDASGRTFDNAEAEDRTYWEQTVLPILLDLEDDINMQLSPRVGDEVAWFDLDEIRVLRQKTKPITAAVGAPAMVQAQLMTIDEARAEYGLPPLPGGVGARLMTADEIQAVKGGSAEQLSALLAEVRGAEGSGAREEPGDDDARGDEGRGLPSTAPAGDPATPPPPVRSVDPELVELRRSKIWRASDAVVRGLEQRWERSFRKLFTRQATSTINRLEGKRGRQAMHSETRAPADEVFDRAYWQGEAEELAVDLYEAVVGAGLDRLATTFGVAFDIASEFAQEFVKARANQLAGQVTATTYEAIQGALAEGIGAGEGIPDLAKRISHVFDVASTSRATVIARTEVISAYNGSAHLGATQLPSDVIGGQEWIATRDGRVRPEHAAADGQVAAMDATFDVGGEGLLYPGDPAGSPDNVIQCRCTVAFLTPGEVLERAGAEREVRQIPAARARAFIDLVHPETDLLAWRRALEAAA